VKLEEEVTRLKAIEKQVLASPDQQVSLTDPDCRSTAAEVMVYLESLTDLLGERRSGTKSHVKGDLSDEEKKEFNQVAGATVRGIESRVERKDLKERWEEQRKK
jgi:hypothetical protein